ncbi:MAG: SNF2 helicase associated domain-containing protein [Deltaproteobacteria bacterium]|nr:SNF2 helicase associated domain-containing protein [Deltaproteobacteria bacterium]
MIRLSYEIQTSGRGANVRLLARVRPDGPPLSEHQAREIQPTLHALDQTVVREMRGAAVFGQLSDHDLARLLPLLAQRQAQIGGARLRLEEEDLRPRVQIVPTDGGGIALRLGLSTASGDWVELEAGRLVSGNQAFFLRGNRAYPVVSPKPWDLALWARRHTDELGAEISSADRDRLVQELRQVGVPPEDLRRLAVHRAPPDSIVVRLLPPSTGDDTVVRLSLELTYAGRRVTLSGVRPATAYLEPAAAEDAGLIERDLGAEEEIRHALRRLGFRFDPKDACFIAHGEQAVLALDPESGVFPQPWVVERSAHQPRFRRDLTVSASVRLQEDRGMLDVVVAVSALDDDAVAKALVEMKDLLAWLKSGKKYVRLADGSFVAPSPRFRQSLRLIDDLGATEGRLLVSPLCVGLLRALDDTAAVMAADEATNGWLQELTASGGPTPVSAPATLLPILRDYQHRGLDWLAMLHRHRLTGILADDMGLGKTVQTLALLLLTRDQEGVKPSLVVAPTSVVTVWRDEAARFTPELSVALWHGAPGARQALDVGRHDLVVTSYGVLRRDAELLAKHRFRYVILDEAQSAKNASTQNARAIRRLQSERRLALTGTPVENRPEELWATFDFLAPGFLGNLRAFRKRYARPIAQGDVDALSLLRARIQPLVLRRMKDEVAKELPPSIESISRCEMLPAQRALYDHIAGELRQSVQEKIEKVGIERAQLDILAALTRLRQICCDPALLPGPPGVKRPGSAKLELFEELMREALASERRVVVFSQFVEMQKRLITVIRRLGVDPLWLHGGTRHRDKVVDAFQTPSGPPVIVISLRAGGTGLTLTRADTVMHYDPWWNPAVERQASDRTHRLGQTRQVTVYKLVCARSIEERVIALAAKKAEVARALLSSEGGPQAKRITPDEVLDLLR